MQQFADLITIFIDRVSIIQQTLQQDGLAAFIAHSSMPAALKVSLLNGLESGGWVLTLQNALVDNASQIVGAGSSYIKNAGSAAVTILGTFFT